MYGILNSNNELIARFTVPLTVRSNKPSVVSDALSLKRFVASSPVQRWEIETGVEPISSNAEDLMVELVTKGKHETIKIKFPQNYSAIQKLNLIEPNVAVMGTSGNSYVTASFRGFISKGSFIKFPNSNKVYMTTQNATSSNILSEVPIFIYPALISTIPGNASNKPQAFAEIKDMSTNMYVDTDSVSGMVYDDGILMEMGTMTFIEAL
jgi:hypothetical protein